MRYSDKDGHVLFNDFVAAYIKLKMLFGKMLIPLFEKLRLTWDVYSMPRLEAVVMMLISAVVSEVFGYLITRVQWYGPVLI